MGGKMSDNRRCKLGDRVMVIHDAGSSIPLVGLVTVIIEDVWGVPFVGSDPDGENEGVVMTDWGIDTSDMVHPDVKNIDHDITYFDDYCLLPLRDDPDEEVSIDRENTHNDEVSLVD